MKFALAKEHHDFFDKEGYIEFEDLIPRSTAERLAKSARQFVANQINRLPERLHLENPNLLFLEGRDCWRKLPDFQKLAMNRNLATIVSNLVRQKPVRLAMDQWIPPGYDWKMGTTVEQIAPIQGILAGIFVALDAGVTDGDTPSIFPEVPGNILVVKPDKELPMETLTAMRNQHLLLLVYSGRNSVYIHRDTDPLTHYLKEEHHYVYGDRLSDSLHPLLLQ